ncbi:hypothetical protein [Clostridium oryzae]|uniref:SpoVT-AbrB domain-containing protein n=1 Tax=Clostridium oryzae TaxID=1450648 RepID=A0A1V4IW15_9CLOT|nr:hypothetical protein [Clostridium oryzae]OPJ64020.1 hypothetical protein CLORY_08920 [Clostridium oryzae]
MKSVSEVINIDNKHYKMIIIPDELFDTIKEKLGDEFIWDYDKKTNRLFLMKKPESYTDFLSGLGKEMWESAGGEDYIKQEREKWDD